MNKYSLKDIAIINKNKESYNVLKLENKDKKYILYLCVNEENKKNEHFEELIFDEEIEITPKKRVTKLKLECLLKDEKYFITMNHKKIYYLTTEKIITNDDNFKLILDNGNIYDKEKIIMENNTVSEKNSDNKNEIIDEVSDIVNDEVSDINTDVIADIDDNKIEDKNYKHIKLEVLENTSIIIDNLKSNYINLKSNYKN